MGAESEFWVVVRQKWTIWNDAGSRPCCARRSSHSNTIVENDNWYAILPVYFLYTFGFVFKALARLTLPAIQKCRLRFRLLGTVTASRFDAYQIICYTAPTVCKLHRVAWACSNTSHNEILQCGRRRDSNFVLASVLTLASKHTISAGKRTFVTPVWIICFLPVNCRGRGQ